MSRAKYKLKQHDGSSGYNLEMEFMEKGDIVKKSLVDDVNNSISQIEGLVSLCAEELYRNLAFFNDLQVLTQRVKDLCSNVKGLIFEEIFMPYRLVNHSLDTAKSLIKKIFELPRNLCEKIFHALNHTLNLGAALAFCFFASSIKPGTSGVLPKGAKIKIDIFLKEHQ